MYQASSFKAFKLLDFDYIEENSILFIDVHAEQIRKAFCSGTEHFPIREIV